MNGAPRLPVLLAILAAAAAAAWLLARLHPDRDPLPEMAAMPYAFITVAAAGYDPARITVVRGSSTPPRSVAVEDGTAWPAYYVADPAVVPFREGRPWIFPLIDDASGQHSPPLPPHGRVLRGAGLGLAHPYVTPEGAEMLQRFRAGHAR